MSKYEGPQGLAQFTADLRTWLDDHPELRDVDGTHTLEQAVMQTRRVQRALYDADWVRWGWSPAVGGLGGDGLLRAIVAEEIVARGIVPTTPFSTTEILGSPVAELASGEVLDFVPRLLSGEEGWCQGFSEPDAGSDLASIRCKAVDNGDSYVVTGQKIWTSFASFASRCVLLVRTGPVEARHRTITALFVDIPSEGMEIRPIGGVDGEASFSEVFYNDVVVPKSRVIGAENQGWAVAMRILQRERGAIFWSRSAWLLKRLREFISEGAATDPAAVGRVYTSIAGLRARSWRTQHLMAQGKFQSAEASIDKVLMATAEQSLFELVRDVGNGRLEFRNDATSTQWRRQYMYSLAASIYGGSSEIQRNIIADHVLNLPKEK